MVSFVKKINEKSKELKEISKTYYDAASNLFKYIDENSKKNITNTDKKIEEINKQVASIDEKIKYSIEELLKDGTKTMVERNTIFTQSLQTILKDIRKAGFSENNNCLEKFLINKNIVSSAEEIVKEKGVKYEENKLQLTITERTLGKEGLRIRFKEGGEYSGVEDSSKFNPSKGIAEVLIENRKASNFTSTDIFGACDFLKKVYALLMGKINNINDSIEFLCDNINNFINSLINSLCSGDYSIEEIPDDCFNVEERWPNYKTLGDSDKQKINNHLSALLDELKSLNKDIINTEDVKILETGDIEDKKAENFYIDSNNVININFQQIFNVNDFGSYVFEDMRRFENATFSGIEGVGGASLIPNIFYKKKFGIKIDDSYYGRSLEDIMNLLQDLSITFEEFKTAVKNSI